MWDCVYMIVQRNALLDDVTLHSGKSWARSNFLARRPCAFLPELSAHPFSTKRPNENEEAALFYALNMALQYSKIFKGVAIQALPCQVLFQDFTRSKLGTWQDLGICQSHCRQFQVKCSYYCDLRLTWYSSNLGNCSNKTYYPDINQMCIALSV